MINSCGLAYNLNKYIIYEMQKTIFRYKEVIKDKNFIWSVCLSGFLFITSLIVNYFAGIYATEIASSPVTDIILSNTKVYNLDGIFVYGSIAVWTFLILLCIYWPKRIPFTLNSLALFITIRAAFISMTHIGLFPTHIPVDTTGIISYFTFGGDLFFSAHTGIPFLLALIFWNQKALRYVFLISSIIFGIVVLLAHVHYTIDVFSAFFITYTIFHLSEKFFKEDREMFNHYA